MSKYINILIIEDDNEHVKSLQFQLSKLGVRKIEVVHSTNDACKSLSNKRFDLVFCSIKTAQIDGITLFTKFIYKANVRGVVAISELDDTVQNMVKILCRSVGYKFVESLNKPFNFEGVSKVINDFKGINSSRVVKPVSKLTKKDIIKAFEEQQIFPLYQPQFSFRTSRLVGVEVLARLDHPEYGVCLPSEFMALVQNMGLAGSLYRDILTKATQAVKSYGHSVALSFNIDQSLLETELFENTIEICEATEFSVENIKLELDEELLQNSSLSALTNLAQLRLHGASLSFNGSGLLSLEKLIDLPFSELKIDYKVISQINSGYQFKKIAQLSLRLAQSLSMSCVAVGVEDQQTWDYLKQIGVDVCQGNLTGEPTRIASAIPPALLSTAPQECNEKMVILIVDAEAGRAKALSVLLKKEISGAYIVTASDVSQVHIWLRDMPVNVLITYPESLELLNSARHFLGKESYKGTFIYIKDRFVEDLQIMPFPANVIARSENLNDIAVNIREILRERSKNASVVSRLSERELSVAKMILEGKNNKAIAYELDINQKTVSTYKTRLFKKLDIESNIELVKILDDVL